MKPLKTIILFALIITANFKVNATTWNEPWQKDIIKHAEYFVLAKVLSNDESEGAKIEIIKTFGNQKLENKILINGFSFLNLTSYSRGHGLHLNFEKDQTYYFLLNKSEDGNYTIPTPTSGFAFLDSDKNVYATFRHSYHQALIPQDIYEKTYTSIWNYYKTKKYNIESIKPFIDEFIDQSPAGFDEDEISIFFLQHAAMETAYLLDMPIEFKRIVKFANSENFHSRVSALQLMANSNTELTKKYLFKFISAKKNDNFEKVIAIWSLIKLNNAVYNGKLLEIKDKLSDEETGFGGDIMDPRIGTHFPSPKQAVLELERQ